MVLVVYNQIPEIKFIDKFEYAKYHNNHIKQSVGNNKIELYIIFTGRNA